LPQHGRRIRCQSTRDGVFPIGCGESLVRVRFPYRARLFTGPNGRFGIVRQPGASSHLVVERSPSPSSQHIANHRGGMIRMDGCRAKYRPDNGNLKRYWLSAATAKPAAADPPNRKSAIARSPSYRRLVRFRCGGVLQPHARSSSPLASQGPPNPVVFVVKKGSVARSSVSLVMPNPLSVYVAQHPSRPALHR
jgi:hypothetical protein